MRWSSLVYRHFAARDLLERVVLERMQAGVSSRRYRGTQEPVGEELGASSARSPGRRSRSFIEQTWTRGSPLVASPSREHAKDGDDSCVRVAREAYAPVSDA
jgi:hypothetical protein